MDFVILVLATIGIHRIWNWEEIFSSSREKIRDFTFWPLNKIAVCPPCNGVWFSAGTTAFLYYVEYKPLLVMFAVSAIVRFFIWTHHVSAVAFNWLNMSTATVQAQLATKVRAITPPPEDGCPTCKKGKESPLVQKVEREQERVQKYEKRVVIMTTLSSFPSSYSVAQCVLDQARAIGMQNPSWLVQVWGMQQCQESGWEDMPPNVELRKIIPLVAWNEDKEDADITRVVYDAVMRELLQLGDAEIITHDLMFISWYINFAKAIHQIEDLKGFRWWHVCHSLTNNRGGPVWRTTVPKGKHTIVTVAAGQEEKFSEYYQGAKVIRVPNIRDPRTWGPVSSRLRRLIGALKLWEADIVQIYPVCTTRMEAKGVHKVMRVFAELQKHKNVRLVICNPNVRPEILRAFKKRASDLGLSESSYAFTSDVLPDTASPGLTAEEVKTLMHGYGNVFLFPTSSEADSLMLAEAQLARQLTITNADVPTVCEGVDAQVHWGTKSSDDSAAVADFAANMTLMMLRGDSQRRAVLQTRNLEGIGNKWGKILAGP
jgi:hypothetical protein